MTLNELIKVIPKEYHDSQILVSVEETRAGDQGNFNFEVALDQIDEEETTIILTPLV